MGYQINSSYTKLRKDDIERLNKIIDDEYCNEQEISRKLNIMMTMEEKLDEAIEDFNFKVVIEFMTQHNWKWAQHKNGKTYMSVPDKNDIIEFIRKDFFKHGLYDLIESGKKKFSCSSGGIVFFMGYDGDYCGSDSAWVSIYFDIANYVGENDDDKC